MRIPDDKPRFVTFLFVRQKSLVFLVSHHSCVRMAFGWLDYFRVLHCWRLCHWSGIHRVFLISYSSIIGHRKGRSLLIEDGVLSWMVAHSTMFSASTRRHIELAFCHLAQNGKHIEVCSRPFCADILPNIAHIFAEDNTCDIIASGGIKELLRISRESPREDTRNLAKKALDSNPAFLIEIQWLFYGQDKHFIVDSSMILYICRWCSIFSRSHAATLMLIQTAKKKKKDKSSVWMSSPIAEIAEIAVVNSNGYKCIKYDVR